MHRIEIPGQIINKKDKIVVAVCTRSSLGVARPLDTDPGSVTEIGRRGLRNGRVAFLVRVE
jgi:hypothetical protein